MEIDDVKKIMDDFINHPEYRFDFINNQHMQEFNFLYTKILSNIEALKKEQGLDQEDVLQTINKIKQLNIVFQNTLHIIPITVIINKFIKAWSMLIYNWNQNILKDQELFKQCNLLNRTIDGHFTIMEAIQNLKIITNYLGRVRGWLPPAIDISKHYFDILQERKK